MSTARRMHHTYVDYLGALALSDVKLEYCDGEIYAMAGGTPTHAALIASATRILGNALHGRCRVYSSDLRVRVEASDLSTFPDVTAVCGNANCSPVDGHAIINPTLIVEVTSASTEDYDRGEKLSHFKQIPSLNAVLFVSHRSPRVTIVTRTHDGWSTLEARSGESVFVAEPELRLEVDDIYEGISLL